MPLGSILNMFAAPLVQAGIALLTTIFQSQKEEETEEAIDAQVEELREWWDTNLDKLQRMYEEGSDEERHFYEEMRDFVQADGAETRERIGNRFAEFIDDRMREYGVWSSSVLDEYGERTDQFLADAFRVSEQVTGYAEERVGEVMGPLTEAGQRIIGGYEERAEAGMERLDRLGRQGRRDIEAQYDDLRSQTRSELSGMGLGRSTVLTSAMADIDERESDELRRFAEELEASKLEWESRTSGESLLAQERLAGTEATSRAGLTGDLLTTLGNLGIWTTEAGATITGEELGALTRLGEMGQQFQMEAGMASTAAQSDLDRIMYGLNLDVMSGYANVLGRYPSDLLNIYFGPALGEEAFLEGITHAYPSAGEFAGIMEPLGYRSTFEAPEAEFDWVTPAVTAGAAAATAALPGVGPIIGGVGMGMGMAGKRRQDYEPLSATPYYMPAYDAYGRPMMAPAGTAYSGNIAPAIDLAVRRIAGREKRYG